MEERRIEWIDIAKGIAILAMVAGHVSLLPWEPVRKLIFSFHMPLFFILSGYTTKQAIDNPFTNIKKYAKQLLLPYLYIAVVSSLVYLSRNGFTAEYIFNEFLRIALGSGVPADYGPGRPIFLKSIPVAGAIWFLPAMFWCKVIFACILKITQKHSEWIRAVICMIVSTAGYIVGQHYKLPLGFDIGVFTIGFLYVGFLIKKYKIMQKINASWALIGVALWYLSMKANAIELSARAYRSFPMCIFAFLGAVGATVVIGKFSEEMLEKTKVIKPILLFAGKKSLYILAMHHLESLFFNWNALAAKIPLPSFYQGVLIAVLRIIVAVLLAWIYVKLYTFLKEKWKNRRIFASSSRPVS